MQRTQHTPLFVIAVSHNVPAVSHNSIAVFTQCNRCLTLLCVIAVSHNAIAASLYAIAVSHNVIAASHNAIAASHNAIAASHSAILTSCNRCRTQSNYCLTICLTPMQLLPYNLPHNIASQFASHRCNYCLTICLTPMSSSSKAGEGEARDGMSTHQSSGVVLPPMATWSSAGDDSSLGGGVQCYSRLSVRGYTGYRGFTD